MIGLHVETNKDRYINITKKKYWSIEKFVGMENI